MSKQPPADERQFIGALLARAEEDRRRILDEAKKEAQEVLSKARSQVVTLREERLQSARRRAETELARQVSQARFEQVAEQARVLDEAATRVVARAREVLGGFRERPAYQAVLARLLDECLQELPHEAPVTVVVDARDRSAVQAELKRLNRTHGSVKVAGPFLGGMRAIGADGRLVIDNTFETRLRARMPAIRARLAGIFGSE